MAQDLDDGEFWLPSEFLTDDDILMEKKTAALNNKSAFLDSETAFCFPTEFPSYRSSDLNSPVQSVVGSTETESDEEDFMAGLNRQMARSILQQAENNFGAPVFDNPKTRVMSGSPQSPLCGVGSWSGRSGSSRGSPNGPSQRSKEERDEQRSLMGCSNLEHPKSGFTYRRSQTRVQKGPSSLLSVKPRPSRIVALISTDRRLQMRNASYKLRTEHSVSSQKGFWKHPKLNVG